MDLFFTICYAKKGQKHNNIWSMSYPSIQSLLKPKKILKLRLTWPKPNVSTMVKTNALFSQYSRMGKEVCLPLRTI